jgi:hypothetical protein
LNADHPFNAFSKYVRFCPRSSLFLRSLPAQYIPIQHPELVRLQNQLHVPHTEAEAGYDEVQNQAQRTGEPKRLTGDAELREQHTDAGQRSA